MQQEKNIKNVNSNYVSTRDERQLMQEIAAHAERNRMKKTTRNSSETWDYSSTAGQLNPWRSLRLHRCNIVDTLASNPCFFQCHPRKNYTNCAFSCHKFYWSGIFVIKKDPFMAKESKKSSSDRVAHRLEPQISISSIVRSESERYHKVNRCTMKQLLQLCIESQ